MFISSKRLDGGARFVVLVLSITALLGCVKVTSLNQPPPQPLTPQQLQAVGAQLEGRLLQIRPQQPIMSVRQKLAPYEKEVVAIFVKALPSGILIEKGNPIYWLDVDSSLQSVSQSSANLKYSVAIRRSDTNEITMISEQIGYCNIRDDANFTYPMRCSLLRPLLLRKALEQL